MDLCLESEAAADLALIRLDNNQRVPTTMIKPLNPPILGNPKLTWSPSCTTGLDSSDFTASVVGYGRTGWAWDFNPLNGDFDVVSEDGNDGRQRAGDFAGHKGLTAPRAFVIEQNARTGMNRP